MTEIYADFVADHTFDHLRLRTTRILCREEHTKAVNPDAKAPKSPPNHAKNQDFSVWEQVQAGSTSVIPSARKQSGHFTNMRSLRIISFYLSILLFKRIEHVLEKLRGN